MVTAKNLSKIVSDSWRSEISPEVFSKGLASLLQKHKLDNLLKKTIKILEEKLIKEKRWNSLVIKIRDKRELDNDYLERIKNILKTEEGTRVIIDSEENFNGGFIASYRGKIIDCRISSSANILLSNLKKPIKNEN